MHRGISDRTCKSVRPSVRLSVCLSNYNFVLLMLTSCYITASDQNANISLDSAIPIF